MSDKTPKGRRRSDTAELVDAIEKLRAPSYAVEAMVGLRNISSYTIGIKSPYANEPDVQLAGPRFDPMEPLAVIPDMNSTATVSHKWWLQIRRSNWIRRGMIERDDSVISAGLMRAPDDATGTIPDTWKVNAIHEPFAWIEKKSEDALRDAIQALTAEESLRRLLTAVNQRIEHQRLLVFRDDSPQQKTDEEREELAYRKLPMNYKLTEEMVLEKLEKDFYNQYDDSSILKVRL
jgi:hypothetical protein